MECRKQKKIVSLSALILVVLLGVFIFGQNKASAASLRISASKTSLAPGDTAILWVSVNTDGVAINNAEASIQYPADLVEVVSISRGSSIFSLWVEEPNFSNSDGLISFSGGVPTPGYTGASGSIISVTVRAKKAGQATFSYSGAAVRANDGLGTNVISGQSGVTLTIASAEEKVQTPTPPTEEPTPQEPKKEPVVSLKVTSPTHPNQELWYKEKKAIFKWLVPTGVDTIQTAIDDNDNGSPRVIYRPAISSKELDITDDGVWYFKVRARKGSVWGPVSTYLARIDSTPPEKKSAEFNYDNNSRTLKISADIQDVTSGIDYYEIYINDNLTATVPAKEFVNNKYDLVINSIGEYSAKLIAYDRAGNSVEVTGTFESKGLPKFRLEPIPAHVSVGDVLVIRGTGELYNESITVNVRNDDGEVFSLQTKSNAEGNFFVFTPKLQAGHYEIWAQFGLGEQAVSSDHIFTQAKSRFVIMLGQVTISGLAFLSVILGLFIILILLAYYFGHHVARVKPLRIIRKIHKQDHTKTLNSMKKRLEKHLHIIQNTRQKRVLTAEEKRIKADIEYDLDEIDRELQKEN